MPSWKSNTQLYILNNGKWYAIANDFSTQVQSAFANTTHSSIALPDCTVNDEAVYNTTAIASLPGACCMDQKFVMHGGGHNRIEFCDLYTSDKKIVHVKKYGGSSVFSHLFSQGLVSGELFASDSEFRRKLNSQLPAATRLQDPTIRPNTSEYEIVYAIISSGTFDIPFFSKVSLRNARRRLLSFGYNVTVKQIPKIDPPRSQT